MELPPKIIIMQTKISQLLQYMAERNYRAAVKLAASWPRLGEHKATIERAWAAYTHPEFYRSLGQDPEKMIQDGLDSIRERYGIE